LLEKLAVRVLFIIAFDMKKERKFHSAPLYAFPACTLAQRGSGNTIYGIPENDWAP
jgi:hypothetical protein